MDWIEAVVYGLVQGLTEYLPVSSSAHLALVPWLTGWRPPSFAFDVLVQLGTLGAVCLYLRDDLRQIVTAVLRGLRHGAPLEDPWARKGWLLVVATIPAVILGLLWKDEVEASFGNPRRVLIELFVTGLLLFIAEGLSSRRSASAPITFAGAVGIGLAQAFAILPGISRSGSTIAGAMVLGMERREAGRFSFLMSIPVMLGAGALGILDLVHEPEDLAREGPALALAFAVAGIVGFAVIRWFLGYLERHSLTRFGLYCCTVSALGLGAMSLAAP